MATKRRKKGSNPVDDLFNAIEAYFESPGAMSKSAFAEAAGISRYHLYELLKRNNDPSYRLACTLAELVGFEIRCERSEKMCQV